MRLAQVQIQNFKCLKDIRFIIPTTDEDRRGSSDFVSIIGKNNVGKSSVLEALRIALPDGDIGNPTIDYFYNRQVEPLIPIEITLYFDITVREAKDMLDKNGEGIDDEDEKIIEFVLNRHSEGVVSKTR